MIHQTEGTLQAVIDDELGSRERARVESHLAECETCAETLRTRRAASAELSAALEVLDRPAPVEAARRSVMARRPRRRFGLGSLPRAAILVLGFGAAASAAVPGSPVRDWAATLLDREPAVREAPAPETPAAEPVDAAGAGVAIMPRDGDVVVSVGRPSQSTRVRILLVEEGAVAVSAERSVDARFETGTGRIGVSGSGPGTITIELPPLPGRTEVRVGDEPYLVRNGERTRVLVTPAERTESEVVYDLAEANG